MSTGLYVEPDKRVSLSVRDVRVNLNIGADPSEKSNSKKKSGHFWSRKTSKDEAVANEEVVVDQSKQILSGLSLDLEAGKVLAIMGGSGSGKTTFLNALASRMDFSKRSENPFRFTGQVEYTPHDPNISYMVQEDIFNPGLTVLETLQFTAKLRLPNSTLQERNELIDFLFDGLDLNKVRNTLVSTFQYKTTLSGGERRRVSLAIQLLTKPQVLFLDEPTTGLDSNTSIHLIQTVKKLASEFGITVILTIHQPRFEILETVDEICVLAKGGNMIFTGPLAAGFDYFEKFRRRDGEVDPDSNFADFLLRISSIDKTDSKSVETSTQKRVDDLIKSWKSVQPLKYLQYVDTFATGSPIIKTRHIARLSLVQESIVLFRRTLKLTSRDIESAIMMQLTMLLLSVICGWIFLKPGNSLAGIRSITSALYVCCELIGFAPMIYEIQRLCMTDGKFLLKESKEGMYSIPSWFIGRRLAKMILEDIPCSLLWSVITFFMWGINDNSNFGIFFINNLLIYMIGISVAHLCFVWGGYSFPIASLISGLYYQLQNSACGYFVNAKTMPVYVRWMKYISNFWYSFGSLTSNQFSDFMGDCPYDTEEQCFEYSGTAVLEGLGFPKRWFATPLVVSLAWFIAFYSASALWIWYDSRRDSVKVVKGRSSKLDKLKFTPLTDVMSPEEIALKSQSSTRITLSLHGITLSLKSKLLKNKILHRPFEEKDLLKDISVSFEPGLNAIMGPSGSGKTTLLNMLTGRTAPNLKLSGLMKLNDSPIPPHFLSKIVSYVVQEDSVLIPSLTVQETLYFQARLRLPPSRHVQIPKIINDLMRKMGLSDVANIPIGDALTKGISGGEKRRVSIAIQLLNNTKIMLLDEPTSGLDSFTSSSIIALLDDLAKTENKTIIMTIHQPKYELFAKFDNVLLLGDGHVLYDGTPLALIDYFANLGFEPEYKMNFADYVLDVINNKSLVEGERETSMQRLITEWESNHAVEQFDSSLFNVHFDVKPFETLVKKRQSFTICLRPLLKRQFTVLMRSPDVLFSRLGQPIGVSVIHALFFSPLKNNSESINNRLGLIQNVLNMYYIGFLNNMSLYPSEKFTFYQEYQDGIYSTPTFMFVYFLNEVPFELLSSFIFSIFVVLVIGLPRTPEMFFTMCYLGFIVLNCGESVGIFFNTVFDHLGIATNILSNFLTLAIFMAGTMSINMPGFFKAFNYLNPLKYTVLASAKLGLQGQTFKCIGGGYECTLDTGEAVMEQYNLKSNFAVDMGVLVVMFIIYRLIAIATVEIKVRYLHR